MRNYPEMTISNVGHYQHWRNVVVFLNAWWTTDELKYALDDRQWRKFGLSRMVRAMTALPPLMIRHSDLIGVRDAPRSCANVIP